MLEIRSSEAVMALMDSTKMASLEDAKRYLRSALEDQSNGKGYHFAITRKGDPTMIGYTSFWRMMPAHFRGEIGYALLPSYWKQGIMSEALERMLQFGFEELNLHSVEANVNPDNVGSKRLLEKLKFQREAYFRENYFFDGRFIDSEIYCRLAKD